MGKKNSSLIAICLERFESCLQFLSMYVSNQIIYRKKPFLGEKVCLKSDADGIGQNLCHYFVNSYHVYGRRKLILIPNNSFLLLNVNFRFRYLYIILYSHLSALFFMLNIKDINVIDSFPKN